MSWNSMKRYHVWPTSAQKECQKMAMRDFRAFVSSTTTIPTTHFLAKRMRIIITRIMSVLACSILLHTGADAATISAASCALSAVSSAISSASMGDTVQVPSGSCTWTSGLTITKNISLIGAGIGNTVITSAYSGKLIVYSPSNNANLFRLSGFTFNLNGNHWLELNNNHLYPPINQLRIDHNRVYGSLATRAIIQAYSVRGVIDNNLFESVGQSGIGIWGDYTGGTQGLWDWQHFPDLACGAAADNLYVEDNVITVNDAVGDQPFDTERGGRYVFRYNTINVVAGQVWPMWDVHNGSQGGGGLYANFGSEIYGNYITAVNSIQVAQFRSGRNIATHNLVNNVGAGFAMQNVTGCPPTGPYYSQQMLNSTYVWLNRTSSTGSLISAYTGPSDCADNRLRENYEWWQDRSPFAGATGIGYGPLASRPATCTTGVAYWATTQSVSNLSGMVGVNPPTPISGTLYVCTSTNTWTSYYTPWTYPHPLRLGEAQGGSVPSGPDHLVVR